jgi:hypothetical protein
MAGADGSLQADEAARRLEELAQLLVDDIRRLLLQLDTKPGSAELSRDQAALATAARVRLQVAALLEQRGAPAVVNVAEQAAIDAADSVAEGVKLGGFTPEMTNTVEQLVGPRMDEVTATFGAAKNEVAAAMRAGVATGAPLNELVDEVARVVQTSYARAQSAVDAAIMGAGRAIIIRSGEDANDDPQDPMVYRYVGPNDGKTREFCAEHVGRCYSLAALDAEDNGDEQPKPVSVYLGGFNCRHSLAPMLASDARAQGYEVNL